MSEPGVTEIRPLEIRRGTPSSSVLFQEGNKISQAPELSFAHITRRLGLDSPTLSDRTLHTSSEGKSNSQKVKAALFVTTHDVLKTAAPGSTKQAADIILATPEIRTNIIVSSKKEATLESAQAKDIAFLREHGGRVLEKRVRDGGLKIDDAINIALAFDTYGKDFTAQQKAQIINGVLGVGAPVPADLSGAVSFVKNSSSTYKAIYQSIKDNLSVRDRKSGLVATSSLAGAARTVYSTLDLCKNRDGLFRYLGPETREEYVPHEISKLTEIVSIVSKNPSIKAVSFDLYDTLVQWTSNQGERRGQMNDLAAHVLQKKYRLPVTTDQFRDASERAWARRWNEHQQHGNEVDIKTTFSWIVEDVARGKTAAEKRTIIKDLERTWYQIELDTSARIPEAQETLKALKERGIKVCLTSNASWSETHIKRVLRRFGLEQYFDAISTSIEHGKMKHPTTADFFHYSWGKLGVRPSEVLHVGDNPWADFDGARFAGGKATRYNNPDSFVEIETNPYYWENPSEYAKKAYEFFRKNQSREAIASINSLIEKRRVPPEELERARKMALEVYQKTRDVIGPAYLALSDKILQKLSSGEAELALCLARDGLPFAIAQKLLLHLEPDRYPNARPEQVRYIHASRKLLDRLDGDPAFQKRYVDFLKKHGVDKVRSLILTDLLCASGKTHEGIKKMLRGKKVEGLYIDVHTDKSPDARSFLKESLNDKDVSLVAEQMLLLFESLFSGPKQSATDINANSNGPNPVIRQKTLPKEVLARGLSEQSLLLLNQIAIMGIQDSTKDLHRRRLLRMKDPTDKYVMERYYSFIASPPAPIWEDIWESTPWQDNGKWYIKSQLP